jgi:hypothetical protein
MKSKEQFRREVDSQKNHKLDPNYVVDITESYSEDANRNFAGALE